MTCQPPAAASCALPPSCWHLQPSAARLQTNANDLWYRQQAHTNSAEFQQRLLRFFTDFKQVEMMLVKLRTLTLLRLLVRVWDSRVSFSVGSLCNSVTIRQTWDLLLRDWAQNIYFILPQIILDSFNVFLYFCFVILNEYVQVSIMFD